MDRCPQPYRLRPLLHGRYRTRYAFSPKAKIIVATSVCTGGSNLPPAGCMEMGSSPMSTEKKEKPHRMVWFLFLVDDIGLEPMTFRTSSGCSSQLS